MNWYDKAEKDENIKLFMKCTGATRKVAIAYLEADEWLVIEAIRTYKLDKKAGLI